MKSLIDFDNETLDDLLCGYKVIQPKKGFRFSIDAVLLAHFTSVKKNDITVDFCSGSGVVAFLITAHKKPAKITCIEIQQSYKNLIDKSLTYNKLEDKVSAICEDIKNANEIFGYESVDYVTCNPPYLKVQTGKISEDESTNIARREVKINLESTIKSAASILKNKGKFAVVHLAERADELFNLMQKYNMPIKRAQIVQPNSSTKPNLILVEGIKNASLGIKWLPTLNVYTDGKYSKEIEDIYGLS